MSKEFTWSDICSEFLMGKITAETLQSMYPDLLRTWAVVCIGYVPQDSQIKGIWQETHHPIDVLKVLLPFRTVRAQWLSQVPDPEFISGHDFGLELHYNTPIEALNVAFELLRRNGHSIRISLGFDTGLLLDEGTYKSLDSYRAQHLLAFTNPHEVTLTNTFHQNISIPDGVGSFPASNPLRGRLGFDFWIAKDYRNT